MNSFHSSDIDFEIERLSEQALCWEPEAESLFDEIGIQQGWKCVDLGCGPVGVLGPLSRWVGPHGQVFGVDQNPFSLQAANKFIKRNHLDNVKVFRGDIYDPSLQPDSFNLSHMRFIFTQIGCDRELLEKMVNVTKTGGVIVSQESDWTTWNCFPPQSPWKKLRKSLMELYKLSGGDINAGLRTYQMFREADLSNIQIRSAIFAMPIGHAYRSGLIRFATTERDKTYSSGNHD